MLAGANLHHAHAYNLRVVFECVRLYGPTSRIEIARRSGLSFQTVSNLIDKLSQQDLILHKGRRQAKSRRGQPPLEIDINPSAAYSVGLNLERDHLTGVLCDLKGEVLHKTHYEVQFPAPAEALLLMQEAVGELTDFDPGTRQRIWGIGVALPGPIAMESGRILVVHNFPGWENVAVRDLLEEKLDWSVYLDNDATAAAVGERWYGAGQTLSNFFYIYFGVNLGGGVVIGGEPYRGATGNAGEFGHVAFNSPLADSDLGSQVSMSILYRKIGASTPQELAKRFEENSPKLLAWLERAAELLTPPIISVESLLDPEAIIFGGRLPNPLLTYLIECLEELLPAHRMRGLPRYPKLLLGRAHEDAAALGAAILPIFERLTPSSIRPFSATKTRKAEPKEVI